MDLVTASQFAEEKGVEKSLVTEACRLGKLYAKKVGTVWFLQRARAEEDWKKHFTKSEGFRKKKQIKSAAKRFEQDLPNPKEPAYKTAEGKEVKVKVLPPAEQVDPGIAGGITTLEAERREKYYKAELAKIKFEEQSGLLVSGETVKKEAFEMGRKTRDAIMSLPLRLAHELAAETDPHRIEVMLTKELTETLDKLAGMKNG